MKKIMSFSICLMLFLCVSNSIYAGGDSDSIVSAAKSANFVIKNDGSLWGWGSDYVGNGGTEYGEDINVVVWTPVKILDNVRSVSASSLQRAAVKKDNTLWVWGPMEGEYNKELSPTYTYPTKVLEDVDMVSVARDWILVLKTDGSVWINNFMTGNGTLDYCERFTKIADDCKYVAASTFNVYYIKADDTLWGYGYNDGATLGNRSDEEVVTPIKILDDVREINADSETIMAVRLDNSLYSWGSANNSGIYTESGWVENAGIPYKVMDNVLSAKADSNGYQMAVIKTDNTLWAWGDDGEFVESYEPVKLYDNVRDMAIGSRHIVVVFRDNTLGTAGENYYKVLGHGDINSWGEMIPLKIMLSDIQDSPNSWASEEVEKAIGLQLIPNEMQGDYIKSINREEFCILAIRMIEVKSGMEIDEYLDEVGVDIAPSNTFDDCDTKEVLAAKALGIVKGISETTFAPDMLLNREMAAVFLTRTAQACGKDVSLSTPNYADAHEISNWAKEYTGYVYDIGVIKGTTGNRFDPKGNYQRQQAFMTMYRIWKAIDSVNTDNVILP
ncbi:RCC1 domain-containing protein [Vallitalea maricola]|uniref:Uncharacterized protein n=1 Tax=Vallitalea maricola TaxID=3074433 RepID=A0ACB5UP42_9FIRM|nr:hypothetical protein AN2V17_28920 [Vallitalea sp. AN17-2]